MRIDAVVRNLKIIGPRNRIVLEYFGVDAAIVWQIICRDLPPFRFCLTQALSRLPSE